MRCKTEQEESGGLPAPRTRKRRGNLRVIVAARKSRAGRETGTRQMTVQARNESSGPDRIRLTAIQNGGAPRGVPPSILPDRNPGKNYPETSFGGEEMAQSAGRRDPVRVDSAAAGPFAAKNLQQNAPDKGRFRVQPGSSDSSRRGAESAENNGFRENSFRSL